MVQIIARGSKDGTVNLYARIYKRNVINNAVALGVSLSDNDWHFVESVLKNAAEAQKTGATVTFRDNLAQNLWTIKNGLDAMLEDGDITPASARKYVSTVLKGDIIKEVETVAASLPQTNQKIMTVDEWISEFIRQCETGERLKQKSTKKVTAGTLKSWRATLAQLEEYERKSHRVLGFEDITMDFYDDWKRFFIKKKYSPNTIGRHIKSLKIFLFAAKDMKLTTSTEFETSRFSADFVEVDNIYLTEERVQQMLDFSPTDPEQLEKALSQFSGDELKDLQSETAKVTSRKALETAKDVFVVGCLTGQRFSDYSRINESMIETLRDGRSYINLTQKKTTKEVFLPVDGRVKPILAKYGGRLPKVYDQKVNKHVKIVGHLLGWTEPSGIMERHGLMEYKSKKKFYECIKTHTARRTFATNAYKNGVSLSSIMAVTGHSSEAMLRKYLKLDNKEKAILAAAEFEKIKMAQ